MKVCCSFLNETVDAWTVSLKVNTPDFGVNNSRSEAKTEAFTAKPLNGIAMMITATNLEASMDFQS